MAATTHFDRRGSNYDRDELHHRIASLLIEGVNVEDGSRVLDIATGTGLVALELAGLVGLSGEVIGVDVSEGMLAEARRKAKEARLTNVWFEKADAERLTFPPQSFDHAFCSSALVLMSDLPRSLRHWRNQLKPGGTLAFDTPSKPFGFSQRVVEAAARHGIRLAYAELADTPDKCRALLELADFEVISIRKAFATSEPLYLDRAIEMYDERVDHPAWRGIREATPTARAAIRASFIEGLTMEAVNGRAPNDTALCFSVARRPK